MANILLVDDEPDNLTVLCDLLGEAYDLERANDGDVALEMIRNGDNPLAAG